MKWYFSHKFVMSSFAIALSTTLISSQTHAAEQQLNEKLTNENTNQSDKKPIHSDPTNHTESSRVAGDTVQNDDITNLYSDNDLGEMPKSEELSQAQSEQGSDLDSAEADQDNDEIKNAYDNQNPNNNALSNAERQEDNSTLTEQNQSNTDQPSTQDSADNQPNPDAPDNGGSGNNQPTPDAPDNGDGGNNQPNPDAPDNGDGGNNQPNPDAPDNGDSGDNQPNPDAPDNGDGGDNQPNPDKPGSGDDGDNQPNPDKPGSGDDGDNQPSPDTPDNGDGGNNQPNPDKPGSGDDGNNQPNPDKPDKPGSGDGSSNNPQPDNPDNGDGGNNQPNPDKPGSGDDGDNQQKPDKPSNGDGSSNNPQPDNPNNGNEPNTPSGGGSEVPDNPHDEGNTSNPNDGSHGGPSTPNNSGTDNTKPSKPNGQEDSNVTLNPGLNTDNNDSNTTNNSMNHANDNGNEPQYRSSSHHEIASGGASVSYGDLAKSEKSQSNENQLINRFDQMSAGSFKYNPFVVNQVKQLSSGAKTVSDKEISSVLRRQTFADNAFLNELQKGTNYFKFQYFNVLKSSDYYKNLDNQVLALITGEIGSMPDLKNPKRQQSSGKYEYHSSSEDELTHTTDEQSKNAIDIKFERTLFALITAMIIIFVGMVLGYFVNRRNKKDGE
ncbi:SdrH family protein [Staphylococcus xylosus]